MKPLCRRITPFALAVTLLGASCPLSPADDEGSTDPAELIGVWFWTDGVDESWAEFSEPDGIRNIYVGLVDQYCEDWLGTWTASEGTLSLTFSTLNGVPEFESESVSFRIADGNLLITAPGEPTEEHGPVSALPSCDDYFPGAL